MNEKYKYDGEQYYPEAITRLLVDLNDALIAVADYCEDWDMEEQELVEAIDKLRIQIGSRVLRYGEEWKRENRKRYEDYLNERHLK